MAAKKAKKAEKPYGEVMRVPTEVYEKVKALQARIRSEGLSILPAAFRPEGGQVTLGTVIDIAVGMATETLARGKTET